MTNTKTLPLDRIKNILWAGTMFFLAVWMGGNLYISQPGIYLWLALGILVLLPVSIALSMKPTSSIEMFGRWRWGLGSLFLAYFWALVFAEPAAQVPGIMRLYFIGTAFACGLLLVRFSTAQGVKLFFGFVVFGGAALALTGLENRNVLSWWLALAAVYWATHLKEDASIMKAGLVFLPVGLILALGSRGGFLGAMVGLGWVWANPILVVLGPMVALAALPVLIALRPATVWERVEIWQAALELWLASPKRFFFGYGASGVDTLRLLPEFMGGTYSHAHNVFLNTALDAGFLGVLALLALLFVAWRSLPQLRRWQRGAVFVLAVIGLVECPFFAPGMVLFLPTLLRK